MIENRNIAPPWNRKVYKPKRCRNVRVSFILKNLNRTNTQTEEKQAASIALCSDGGPAAHQIKMQWAFIDLLLQVCNSLRREMELEGEGGEKE